MKVKNTKILPMPRTLVGTMQRAGDLPLNQCLAPEALDSGKRVCTETSWRKKVITFKSNNSNVKRKKITKI